MAGDSDGTKIDRDRDDFLAFAQSPSGHTIAELNARLSPLFSNDRSRGQVDDYRRTTRPWKKIRDEVVPALRFFQNTAPTARLRFPLDNGPADAWVWYEGSSEPIGVELTVAQGRARNLVAERMIATGWSPGFFSLQDNDDDAAFARARNAERIMRSTEGILDTMEQALRRCLEAKNRPGYAGFILLIVANFGIMEAAKWQPLLARLTSEAEEMPFGSIYAVPEGETRDWHLQLK